MLVLEKKIEIFRNCCHSASDSNRVVLVQARKGSSSPDFMSLLTVLVIMCRAVIYDVRSSYNSS